MNTAAGKNSVRKSIMAGTIRARVERGMLELLEKIDLPEGKEVSVTILGTSTARGGDGLQRSAGAGKGLVNADKLIENIYADRLISSQRVSVASMTS
jgi:predicted DNA-binding antitoxin AbrB/MazE fold protein